MLYILLKCFQKAYSLSQFTVFILDEVTCTKDGMTVRVQLPGVGNYIPPYVKGYYNDPNCPATQFKEDLFDVVFSSLTVCGLVRNFGNTSSLLSRNCHFCFQRKKIKLFQYLRIKGIQIQ